jgi:hypothetical protein
MWGTVAESEEQASRSDGLEGLSHGFRAIFFRGRDDVLFRLGWDGIFDALALGVDLGELPMDRIEQGFALTALTSFFVLVGLMILALAS